MGGQGGRSLYAASKGRPLRETGRGSVNGARGGEAERDDAPRKHGFARK